MMWQPIETAPRDETAVLLFCQNKDWPIWVGRWFSSPKEIDDGWETEWGSPGDDFEPTHWMPLPEAPS